MTIVITKDKLAINELRNRLSFHPCCGAIVQFEGVVRNHNQGKDVDHITYECYDSMAQNELSLICAEAKTNWPIHQVIIAHRVGRIEVGEVSLLLIVTAPHRKEALSAVQFIINNLKKRVPIWKKEGYLDGDTAWVECEHEA